MKGALIRVGHGDESGSRDGNRVVRTEARSRGGPHLGPRRSGEKGRDVEAAPLGSTPAGCVGEKPAPSSISLQNSAIAHGLGAVSDLSRPALRGFQAPMTPLAFQ